MKKIVLNILFLILLFFLSPNKLLGQNLDSTDDTLNKGAYIFSSVSFVTSSSLMHINPFDVDGRDIFNSLTFPTGLFFSLRFGKVTGGGLSTGLLFDIKKYYVEYYTYWFDSNSNLKTKTGKCEYNYLYIPVLFNYYYKNTYLSLGLMHRIPIYLQSKNKNNAISYIPNPYRCFQIGFGKIIQINNNLDLQIEPYLSFWGKTEHFGKTTTVVSNEPLSGLSIVVYFKITYKIKL